MILVKARNLIALLLLTLITGCGGQTTVSGTGVQNPQPGTDIQGTLKLSSQGGTQLFSGMQVNLTLPPGVTIATNPDGTVANGVITPSGQTLGNGSSFSSSIAYNGSERKLQFILVSSLKNPDGTLSGFGAGEFATVAFHATGTLPAPSAFSALLEPIDVDGRAVTGVTAAFQVVP